MKAWSEEENKLLMSDAVKGLPWKEVSTHFQGRSSESCQHHYFTLVKARPKEVWSKEENDILLKKASALSWKTISAYFGRSVASCQDQHERLTMTRPTRRKAKHWSRDEDELLMERASMCRHQSSEQWIKGRSWLSCEGRYRRLKKQ